MKTEPNTIAFPRPSGHLTEAQFGELLASSAKNTDRALTPAEEHLLTCEQCTAELAELREAIVLFRGATTAYADDQLRTAAPIAVRARGFLSPTLRPMYFVAVAALVLAAFLPIQAVHRRSLQAAPPAAAASAALNSEQYAAESDEALLEDVDRAASATLPDSMQVLADPMGNTDLSVQKSNQRKY
ncbi:MAG TPA: hypothetical protein VII58_08770 [Acidobacteriaceae bacterium]